MNRFCDETPSEEIPSVKTSLAIMKLSEVSHVVSARQQAREIAVVLGFESHDQTRIATAVSEVARDVLSHARLAEIEYLVEILDAEQLLLIEIKSHETGKSDTYGAKKRGDSLNAGLSGIAAARRLMEQFRIEQAPGGRTVITLGKRIPAAIPGTSLNLESISSKISARITKDPIEEIRQQNMELVSILEALRIRQEELTTLNQELEDTNRGILALYGELDQRSEYLKKAYDIKSRSLSEMSHELRTPINSILAITQILLDRSDGDLTEEQEKQINFIKTASQNLSELINDLLDLSKIEAGKTRVNPSPFEIRKLFGTLKSMLKPLLSGQPVELVFEESGEIEVIVSDEGKVSQVLRNLISNAIKFTEKGEVRVSTSFRPEDREVVFAVSDTGIGIAPEFQDIIFNEFAQVEGPLQKSRKGTGLGLPLARKLAEMMGGTVFCQSLPGVGSTFFFSLPIDFKEAPSETRIDYAGQELDPMRHTVLIVEDDLPTAYAYEGYLRRSAFQVIHAGSIAEAKALLKSNRPMAIVLDILLEGEDSWGFLSEIKHDTATMNVPVLVCSVVDEPGKAMVLGAQDFCPKPVSREWLLEKLQTFAPVKKILVVDDDVSARYIMKWLLADTIYTIVEASDGKEALRMAVSERPDIIFLDLVMPGMNGFDTLRHLKAERKTRDIPVIIITSKDLDESELSQLEEGANSILHKDTVTRMTAMEKIRDALTKIRRS